MSRTRTNVPAYQKHSSGRARVRTYDSTGKRIEHILPGEYGSKESQDAYVAHGRLNHVALGPVYFLGGAGSKTIWPSNRSTRIINPG